jgi:hypothetical protein
MSGLSRSKPACDPTTCEGGYPCSSRYQQRKDLIRRSREKIRFMQQRGKSAKKIAKFQDAVNRFDRNNEAMVRARAAAASYNPTQDAECTRNLSKDVNLLNQEMAKQGKRTKFTAEDFIDHRSGFRAVLYRSESNGRYILAFAGTDPHALSDWETNIDNGRGEDTIQYREARKLAKKLKEYGIDADITGHSKGGGLATEAGMVDDNAQVWTFNSAGLNPASLARTNTANFDDLANRTQAFRTDGDFLTAMQEDKDPSRQIANAKNLKAMLEGTAGKVPSKSEGELQITRMNPDDTDSDQLPEARDAFLQRVDNDIIKKAEEEVKKEKQIDLFPRAIGQPRVLGQGYRPWVYPRDMRPLIRHLMKGQFGTNGVMDDMEAEKFYDERTLLTLNWNDRY